MIDTTLGVQAPGGLTGEPRPRRPRVLRTPAHRNIRRRRSVAPDSPAFSAPCDAITGRDFRTPRPLGVRCFRRQALRPSRRRPARSRRRRQAAPAPSFGSGGGRWPRPIFASMIQDFRGPRRLRRPRPGVQGRSRPQPATGLGHLAPVEQPERQPERRPHSTFELATVQQLEMGALPRRLGQLAVSDQLRGQRPSLQVVGREPFPVLIRRAEQAACRPPAFMLERLTRSIEDLAEERRWPNAVLGHSVAGSGGPRVSDATAA